MRKLFDTEVIKWLSVFQKRFKIIGIIFASCLFSNKAFASVGCDQVNAGAWNASLQSFAIGSTLGQFDPGDQIHFHVSGNGQLTLLGSKGGSYVDVLVVNTPGSKTYVIPTNFTLFRTLNDAVSGPLLVTATCTPASVPPIPSPTVSTAPRLPDLAEATTRSFLSSRINGILLSQPQGISLLNQEAATMSSIMPTSKSNIIPSTLKALLPFSYKTFSSFDLWLDAGYSSFDDSAVDNLESDGHVYVFYAGADYRINPNMLIGVVAQYDTAKDNVDSFDSEINGNGWLLGPYFSARLYKTVFLDLRAGWGRSYNNLTMGDDKQDYATSRWLAEGSLSSYWLHDRWRVTPSFNLQYMIEKQNPFTFWDTTYVPSQSIAIGRIQFGPEVGYRFIPYSYMTFEPFVAIRGVWNFHNPDITLINDSIVNPDDLWARLEGGFTIHHIKGILLRGSVSRDGIGASNYGGYTAQMTLGMPMG